MRIRARCRPRPFFILSPARPQPICCVWHTAGATMTTTTTDPFAKFKAAQREAWACSCLSRSPPLCRRRIGEVRAGGVRASKCSTLPAAPASLRSPPHAAAPRHAASICLRFFLNARATMPASPMSISSSSKGMPRRFPIRMHHSTSCSANLATFSRRVRPSP